MEDVGILTGMERNIYSAGRCIMWTLNNVYLKEVEVVIKRLNR